MPHKNEIHTKKWHDLVKAIKKKGGALSAEAVATKRLGSKAFLKSSTRKSKKVSRSKSGKVKHSKIKKMIKISKSGKKKKGR